MSPKWISSAITLGLLAPLSAIAYMTPEEVLLNETLYLPPQAREAQGRAERQAEESAYRRTLEYEEGYALQHPPEPEPVEQATTDETMDGDLSAADRKLLSTLRLLQRVEDRQQTLQYGGDARLHGGAPPLAPTGPGAILSALAMVGATGWTLKRAKGAQSVWRKKKI